MASELGLIYEGKTNKGEMPKAKYLKSKNEE